MYKIILTIILFCTANEMLGQTKWTSYRYGYSIAIPQGFTKTNPVGANVDFKAERERSSIVIVMKTIPQEYASYSIWELIGDLDSYASELESGAQEYMKNPKMLKYGKTKINNYEAFWYDQTTDNPKMYSKTYQTQKGNKVYTITLTSEFDEYNYYSPIWYRFKEQMKL